MLQNQVVIVTGCSSGIGEAVARELNKQGHRVFATARRLESLESLEKDGLSVARLDVTDRDSISQTVDEVVATAGRVDMLINNAGINTFGPLTEIPIERVQDLINTNVVGLLAVTQEVFPHMARARNGRIVNIGSVVGLLPTPFAGIYCASKAAVHMLSDVLRMETEAFGISVTVVQPGGVRSEISNNGSQDLERYKKETSFYRTVYSGIKKRADSSQYNAMETEEFAEQLVNQVMQDEPPRIVRLGTGSDYLPEVAKLPGEEIDKVMTAQFGLDKLVH